MDDFDMVYRPIDKCNHSRVVSNCNYCKIIKSKEEYNNNEDRGVLWVECVFCGMRSRDLSMHYNKVHNINANTRKALHIHDIICEDKKKSHIGERNPAYNHGGKFSPYSSKFIGYGNEMEYLNGIKNITKKANTTKLKNSSNNTTAEFFIQKYSVSREEALSMLRDRQSLIYPNGDFRKKFIYLFNFKYNGSSIAKVGITDDFCSRYTKLELLRNKVSDLCIFEPKNSKNTIMLEYLIKTNFERALTESIRHTVFGYTETFNNYQDILTYIRNFMCLETRFVINRSSRGGDTSITLRNKTTNEIITMNIGDFHDMIKNRM